MRRTSVLILVFLAFFCLCFWGGSRRGFAANENAAGEPAGYVDALTGKAEAVHPALGRRDLALESPVYPKDVVSTGENGALRIVFRDESTLEMHASSSLNIAEFAYDPEDKGLGEFLVKYAKGVFRAVTGSIVKENPGHFALEAPLASVGIRGTEIGSRVDSGGELHALLSGTPIVVSGTTGPPQTVAKAEYGVDVAPGAAVAPPRELTEEEKRLFTKLGFARQMDILRRQTLFKTRTMFRPPKMKTHF